MIESSWVMWPIMDLYFYFLTAKVRLQHLHSTLIMIIVICFDLKELVLINSHVGV